MLKRLLYTSASVFVLALATALALPGIAMADVPDAGTSSKPACIILVGDNGTRVDSSGTFKIVVHDLIGNTVANSNVVLDFSACTEVHIANQASQLFTGMTITPVGKKVSAISNNVGVAWFDIEGAIDPSLAVAPSGCIVVAADNVPFGTMTATAINTDVRLGVGTLNPVNAADVAFLLQRQLPVPQPYKASSDLNCDGTMNGADTSILLQHLLIPDASTVCPNPTTGYAW